MRCLRAVRSGLSRTHAGDGVGCVGDCIRTWSTMMNSPSQMQAFCKLSFQTGATAQTRARARSKAELGNALGSEAVLRMEGVSEGGTAALLRVLRHRQCNCADKGVPKCNLGTSAQRFRADQGTVVSNHRPSRSRVAPNSLQADRVSARREASANAAVQRLVLGRWLGNHRSLSPPHREQ